MRDIGIGGGDEGLGLSEAAEAGLPRQRHLHARRDLLSTLSQELVHWSGVPQCLDRVLKTRFGSQAFAAEERVAELGAAFLCSGLGIGLESRPDHAPYAATWLKILKNDIRAIFTAASKAQQAVQFLHGLGEDDAASGEADAAIEQVTGEPSRRAGGAGCIIRLTAANARRVTGVTS